MKKILTFLGIVILVNINIFFAKEFLKNPEKIIETQHLIKLPEDLKIVKDFEYGRIDDYQYQYSLLTAQSAIVMTTREKQNPWEKPEDCYYGLHIDDYKYKENELIIKEFYVIEPPHPVVSTGRYYPIDALYSKNILIVTWKYLGEVLWLRWPMLGLILIMDIYLLKIISKH